MRDNAIAQQRTLRLLTLKPLPIKIVAKATHRSPSAVSASLRRLIDQGYVATRKAWDFKAGRYVDLYFATRHGLDQSIVNRSGEWVQ